MCRFEFLCGYGIGIDRSHRVLRNVVRIGVQRALHIRQRRSLDRRRAVCRRKHDRMRIVQLMRGEIGDLDVPLYYLFYGVWKSNYPMAGTAALFLIFHTMNGYMNFVTQ